MTSHRIDAAAPPDRRDLEFTIYESVLIPLPAATRKAVIIGPPGSAYRLAVDWTDAAATSADGDDIDRTGGGVTVDAAASVTVDYWPRSATSQKRVHIDGQAYLQLFPDRQDSPIDPPPAGDYQLFAYPPGDEPAAAADRLFVPLRYGRVRLRARPHYFNALDMLDEQLARLRDALTDAERAPESAALLEIETADGRRERYASPRALLAAIHELEQRRGWLLATDGGKRPLTGFQLTDGLGAGWR